MSKLTFAIGDIHGCLDKLVALVAECAIYANGRDLCFVTIGDYVDRGPYTQAVVDLLSKAQMREPERWICLKGNHEDMLLLALSGDRDKVEHWMDNGGAETLASYNCSGLSSLPQHHIAWIKSLRLSYDDGRRFFCHAGVNPKHRLDSQKDEVLLWCRKEFSFDDTIDPGRLVVHGHTPQTSGKPDLRRPYRVNIDTFAYGGGPLTAAVFSDDRTEPLAFITDRGEITEMPK